MVAEPLDSASEVAGWTCYMYWTVFWPSSGPPAGAEIIASCWSAVLGTELVPLLGSKSCPSSPCTIGSPNFCLGARSDRGEMGLPVKAAAKARIGEQALSPPLGIVAAFSLVGWKGPQGPPKKKLLGADK